MQTVTRHILRGVQFVCSKGHEDVRRCLGTHVLVSSAHQSSPAFLRWCSGAYNSQSTRWCLMLPRRENFLPLKACASSCCQPLLPARQWNQVFTVTAYHMFRANVRTVTGAVNRYACTRTAIRELMHDWSNLLPVPRSLLLKRPERQQQLGLLLWTPACCA